MMTLIIPEFVLLITGEIFIDKYHRQMMQHDAPFQCFGLAPLPTKGSQR